MTSPGASWAKPLCRLDPARQVAVGGCYGVRSTSAGTTNRESRSRLLLTTGQVEEDGRSIGLDGAGLIAGGR